MIIYTYIHVYMYKHYIYIYTYAGPPRGGDRRAFIMAPWALTLWRPLLLLQLLLLFYHY